MTTAAKLHSSDYFNTNRKLNRNISGYLLQFVHSVQLFFLFIFYILHMFYTVHGFHSWQHKSQNHANPASSWLWGTCPPSPELSSVVTVGEEREKKEAFSRDPGCTDQVACVWGRGGGVWVCVCVCVCAVSSVTKSEAPQASMAPFYAQSFQHEQFWEYREK